MRRCSRSWRSRAAWPRSWPRTPSPRRSRISSAPAPTSSRSAGPISSCCSPASTSTRRARNPRAATAASAKRPSRNFASCPCPTPARAPTAPARASGGKRQAASEDLRFAPVPTAGTRVEGALAGQYDFADLLPVEALPRLEKSGGKTVPIMTPSFGFPYLVLNTKEGVAASQPVRQAIQTALGAGERLAPRAGGLFWVAEGNQFPRGSLFYSTAGGDQYNQRNAAKAKELAAKAGYKGDPIRVLTSRQYDFHYNMSLLMAEQFKRAGFKVDLKVVDGATLVQRRNDAKLWDIYVPHSGQLPEPMLSPPQLGDGAPGWWDTPTKKAALQAFNVESDPAKRSALWGKVQQVVYDEVPYINLGKFNSLSAKSPALDNYTPATWPFFWNAKIK